MGFLKRLFGGGEEQRREPERSRETVRLSPEEQRRTTDEEAIARYRYLIRTAPPEAIEQAHAEAFARLTPEQRRQVLEELSKELPPHERVGRDDPQSLARMATRAEIRQPGVVERIFVPTPMMGGYGMMGGGLFGGGFMSSLAGAFVGSMIAQGLYDSFNDIPSLGDNAVDPGADGTGGTEVGYDQPVDAQGDNAGDMVGDYGAYGEAGGDIGTDLEGDLGGDFGDFGGDFGGGEF